MYLHATDRVFPTSQTNAVQGTISWDTTKSIWLFVMIAGGVAAIIFAPSWSGFMVFLGTTAITVCAGHSVGMHRLLIHKSFQTPKWLEYTLVWLGTLVGMAGPFGMIRAHDMRDWHQRQAICPPPTQAMTHVSGVMRGGRCIADSISIILHILKSSLRSSMTAYTCGWSAIGWHSNSRSLFHSS